MLKDFVNPSTEITVSKDMRIAVKGLTLNDIGGLLATHQKELNDVFSGARSFSDIIEQSPWFAAQVIALAAGEPDQVEAAHNMTAGVQLAALEAIWDLTVPDEETLGKLVQRVLLKIRQYDQNGSDGLLGEINRAAQATTEPARQS